MRLRLIATLAVMGAALASCQTITPEERRAADQQTCTRYGFRPGTDAMARCLLDIELDRRADRRAWRAESDAMMWQQPIVVARPVYIRRH